MKKSHLSKSYLALALFGLMVFEVQAATISLLPTSANIDIGETATFDMYLDAADVGGILAGGLDMFYDIGILRYNGDFAFDPLFPTDPSFSRLGDDCATVAAPGCSGPGEINGIAFGSFTGLGASGPTLVGSLSFTGMATGTSLLTMFDNDHPAGSWFANDGSPIIMDYIGSSVVIPIPAAVWLFGSGLLGLVGMARRKKV